MDKWRPVLTDSGQVFINGNNIVMEHIETKEIGYLENTLENREEILGSNDIIQISEANNEELNCSFQSNNNDNDDAIEVEDEPVNKFKWNQNRSKLLIQKRLGKEKDFNNPKSKKIKLWGDIAKDINVELKGACTVNAVECDTKYRNLLKTYKVNKKKQKTTGEESISWEFFTQFDEILSCKASIEPPTNNLLDTLDIGDNQAISRSSESSEETVSASDGTRGTNEKKTEKGKKNLLQFNEYLFLKNKREEEKRVAKETFESKKWEEEKELRKEEASAMLKLAEALAKKD